MPNLLDFRYFLSYNKTMKNEVNYLKKYLEASKQVTELKGEVKRLNKYLADTNKRYNDLGKKFEEYKKEEEQRITAAVDKAISEVTKKYEKIIEEKDNEIEKLKSRLNMNSTNSSIPSSSELPFKKKIQNNREKSEKNIGGQVGHKRHTLDYFKEEEITNTIEYALDVCPCCGGMLEYIDTVISDIIDFEIDVTKTRNNIRNYYCKNCKKKVTANEKLPRGVSYGEKINALCIGLVNDSNVAINKVRKHICGITNGEIEPSEGYIAKLQKKASKLTEEFLKELKTKITTLEIVHWDDTTIKLLSDDKDKKTKQGTIRFYGDDSYALLVAHESKNKDGIDEDGILENLPNTCTCVHDHVLLNYNNEYEFKNAECNEHILRYLKDIKENIHDHIWQDKLSKLLKETNEEKNKIIEEKQNKEEVVLSFSNDKINDIYNEYREIIKIGYEENKNLPDYHFYKEKELLLITRLDKYINNHLLFASDFKVPFTNNTAERGLRVCKRKLAVSFMFKNIGSARDYANIQSYGETCYRNGINKMLAYQRLLNGNPYTITELESLLKSKEEDN